MSEIYFGTKKICRRMQIGKQRFKRMVEEGLPAKKIAGIWTLREEDLQKFLTVKVGGGICSPGGKAPP